jgi:hypothetical protein
MLGKIFLTKGVAVAGELIKLKKEELRNFSSSPNKIRVIK